RAGDLQAATIPDEGDEEDGAGKQLLRAGQNGGGVRRHPRGQVAKRRGDQIGQGDDAEQGGGNFALGVTRTREETLNEQSHKQQEREQHPADPKCEGRPMNLERLYGMQFEKKEAGGAEHHSGKEKAGTEDEGDAVLRALEPDQGDGREHEREQPADDLQVALERRVGVDRNRAQPKRQKEDDEKRGGVPEKRRRLPAVL